MSNRNGFRVVLVACCLILMAFPTPADAFLVLVGLNTFRPKLHPNAIPATRLFACDGCDMMPMNSLGEFTPAQWRQIVANCGSWVTVSSHYTHLQDYEYVSQVIGRRPNDWMIYIECRESEFTLKTVGKVRLPPDTEYNEPGGTVLKPARIEEYSASRGGVPITVLTAAYRGGWKTAVDRALADPRVSGVTMEYMPESQLTPMLGENIKAIVQAGKRAYVLTFAKSVHENMRMIELLNQQIPDEMASDKVFFVVSNYAYHTRDLPGAWFDEFDHSVVANIACLKTLKNYRGRKKATRSYDPPTPPRNAKRGGFHVGEVWQSGESKATVVQRRGNRVVFLYDSGKDYKAYFGGTLQANRLQVGNGLSQISGEVKDGNLIAEWRQNGELKYEFTFRPQAP